MKAQVVIISSYIAAVLVIITMITLYVMLYPWMGTFNVNYKQVNVLRIIREKTYWDPKELAMKISNVFGASYVYVNITGINIVNMQTIYQGTYNITPLNTPISQLTIFKYRCSRTLRNGTIYIYYIEVGYK